MEAYEYACAEEPRCDAIRPCAAALDRPRVIVPRRLPHGRVCSDVEELPYGPPGQPDVRREPVLVPEEIVTTDYRVPPRHGFGVFPQHQQRSRLGQYR